MDEPIDDDREFTDEQLRAALKRVGQDAREATFAAGRPVVIAKGELLVALHADGTEEVIGPLTEANGSGAGK